jgi:hypothetical protein
MSVYLERSLNGGSQVLHKFENGFGASVVQHEFSYGADEGLFELGVIKFENEDEWHLNYSTSVTDDVLGYLTEEDVQDLLTKIEQLESK